jgi:hypothetical protein
MKKFDLMEMFNTFVCYKFKYYSSGKLWYHLQTTNDVPFQFAIPVEELGSSMVSDIETSKLIFMKWVKKAIEDYNEELDD